MTKIKLLDTFAWVGGFHLALEQNIWKENVECIWFSEIDKFATQVYKERFSESPELWSITELDIDGLPDFDLLTGWFPCQDVSVAWKQSLEWWRTVLVEYLLQILEKKQPRYFVFENVKGLMSKKFDTFRKSIFDRMENAWYNVWRKVLNTKDFWLPQNRERVFIVWMLAPSICFETPQWKELTTFLKDILEEEVDEKYYMTVEQFKNLNFESLQRLYTEIAPTLNTSQWWHRQPKILVNRFNKRVMPEICWTLWYYSWFTNKQGYQVIEWEHKIRKLTPREYERLQGFPRGWSSDIVSNSQAYKQMWNAISVPVVKAIFDNLFKV